MAAIWRQSGHGRIGRRALGEYFKFCDLDSGLLGEQPLTCLALCLQRPSKKCLVLVTC